MDAANNSALFSAIPALVEAFGITESESTWIISAFQLTFASFLLIVSLSSHGGPLSFDASDAYLFLSVG